MRQERMGRMTVAKGEKSEKRLKGVRSGRGGDPPWAPSRILTLFTLLALYTLLLVAGHAGLYDKPWFERVIVVLLDRQVLGRRRK